KNKNGDIKYLIGNNKINIYGHNSVFLSDIKVGGDTDFCPSGSGYPAGTFLNFPCYSGTPLGTAGKGQALVMLTWTVKGDVLGKSITTGLGGLASLTKTFFINVDLDAAGKITDCSAVTGTITSSGT